MQKNIIALAIAAACAAPVAAMAEATFYGSMDGGVRHQVNDGSTVDAFGRARGITDSMKMGQYNTARWGFKAVDDLGDGMKANVVLETSFAPGGVGANSDLTSGAPTYPSAGINQNNPFGLIFDRQATVGLEGGLGKFDMGWNYSTAFTVMKTYDPMDYKFLGVAMAKTSGTGVDRNANFVYTGKFGDVGVRAEYVMPDEYQTRQDNFASAGRALGVTYAANGLNVGGAYSTQEKVKFAGFDNSFTHMTLGAGYNFGDGKVSAGYAKKTQKTNTVPNEDTVTSNMWLGASYNMTAKVAASAAYYKRSIDTAGVTANTDSNVMIAAVTYALSKKSKLYFELDKTVAVGTGGAKDQVTSGTAAGLDVSF